MANNEEQGLPGRADHADKLVLIVEDDESVGDLFFYVVRREGFRTEQAADGKEALEKARLLHPALILLDLMLPRLGGYEILRELQEGDTAGIPIVLASSRDMDSTTLEMLRREPNVKDFMQKPVDARALAALLHKLLKTRPPVKEEK